MPLIADWSRRVRSKRSIARNGAVVTKFLDRTRLMPAPRILELGTRQVDRAVSSRRDRWVPHAAAFVGVDFAPGPGVDITADAHHLAASVGEDSFDAVIACSVFEHLERPWVVATEIARVLRRGGLVFVQTHQTFPLHAHPHDYWRFSTEALGLIFHDAGLATVDAAYEFRARIFAARTPRAFFQHAYLNVCFLGEKP